MEDLNMAYIVESICPSENLVTIYYRCNLNDANKWAQFLKDEYHVETEIYTEYDYMKLHPDKFYEHTFDNIFESDETNSVDPGCNEGCNEEFDYWRHCYEDAGVYDEEGRLLQHDSWAY